MKNIKKLLDPYRDIVEMMISSGIFIALCVNKTLFVRFDFFNVVYALLAYIVILELIRMVGQYLFADQKQIRIIIDTFIIFILREIILTYSDKSMNIDIKSFYIVSGFVIMFMLFHFRKKSMIESPYETNCNNCLAKNSCENAK